MKMTRNWLKDPRFIFISASKLCLDRLFYHWVFVMPRSPQIQTTFKSFCPFENVSSFSSAFERDKRKSFHSSSAFCVVALWRKHFSGNFLHFSSECKKSSQWGAGIIKKELDSSFNGVTFSFICSRAILDQPVCFRLRGIHWVSSGGPVQCGEFRSFVWN